MSKDKYYANNIWNKEDFRMYAIGKKIKIFAKLKYIKMCIKWSWQRIVRGYADCDVWDMYSYLQHLIPEMLQDLKDNRQGSPSYLGENYTNEDGIMVNDTCHEEWDKILDDMIFLWKESCEETCKRTNPYYDEYNRASEEFAKLYGTFGDKLQTEAELENNKKTGYRTIHFMDELPQYKDISEKYFAEDKKIDEYRNKCKDSAIDLLKEHFYALWD